MGPNRLILMLEGFSKLGWSGLTIVGILVFREPATVARMFFCRGAVGAHRGIEADVRLLMGTHEKSPLRLDRCS